MRRRVSCGLPSMAAHKYGADCCAWVIQGLLTTSVSWTSNRRTFF